MSGLFSTVSFWINKLVIQTTRKPNYAQRIRKVNKKPHSPIKPSCYIPHYYLGLRSCRVFTKEFTKLMAATYNITINQNADFRRAFQVKEDNVILDITSYTFSGRLKETFNHSGHVDFTTAIVNAAQGSFSVALIDAETGAMDPGTRV